MKHATECGVLPPYVSSNYYMCTHTATFTAVHNGVAEGGALEATLSENARAELYVQDKWTCTLPTPILIHTRTKTPTTRDKETLNQGTQPTPGVF
jgi:hypothetical protein